MAENEKRVSNAACVCLVLQSSSPQHEDGFSTVIAIAYHSAASNRIFSNDRR